LSNNIFLEAEDLLKELKKGKITVVDVRSFWKYAKGHIPKALWFYIIDLTQQEKGIPSKPKEVEELAKVLGKNGISREDRIVIAYDKISAAAATYLFWYLEYLGQEEVKLLKGGMEVWEFKGYPLEQGIVKAVQKEYKPNLRKEIRASLEDVLRVVENKEEALLIDIRTLDEFLGKIKTTPKPGKIPGALLMDPELFLNALYGDEKALNEIVKILQSSNKRVISYCSTGERASLAWFVLNKMLRYGNVKLYPESFYEYSIYEGNKIETGLNAEPKKKDKKEYCG